MLDFIMNNIGTIIVSVLLLGIVSAIIIVTVRNKKRGKTSCGCGCSNCAMSGICHKQDGDGAEKKADK